MIYQTFGRDVAFFPWGPKFSPRPSLQSFCHLGLFGSFLGTAAFEAWGQAENWGISTKICGKLGEIRQPLMFGKN